MQVSPASSPPQPEHTMTSKTDIQLKKEVEQELSWDPKINAAQIGVTVDDGVVSLRGDVDTYVQAKKVSGVRTVAHAARASCG